MPQKKDEQQVTELVPEPLDPTPNEIEQIAKACHEANRAYCASIGDNSQMPWDDAPDWQKESVIDGVKFRLENPELTPERSHENWLKCKELAGWVYGEVKDAEKKTHPCFVPYSELPEEQRKKDEIFLETFAKAMMDMAHLRLPGVVPVDGDTTSKGISSPPAFNYRDVHGRNWSFYKEEKWLGFATSDDSDEMAGIFKGALDDWTEETIREYVDATPNLTQPDKLPATGENPDERLDRGNDGPEVPAEEPEDAEAPSGPTTVVRLDFNSARHQGAEIGQWCHLNGAKHMPDNYERKYELIVPTGTDLPDFIKALVIS